MLDDSLLKIYSNVSVGDCTEHLSKVKTITYSVTVIDFKAESRLYRIKPLCLRHKFIFLEMEFGDFF